MVERGAADKLLRGPSGNSRLESRLLKPETRCVRWKKITLVGVGLLGGSLGMALRKRRLAESVVGFVRRAASVAECEGLGAVNLATRDLRRAVEGAELIVLCTPIAQMRGLVEQMLPGLKPGAIVTDVGSVKGSVVRDLEALVAKGGAHFVGSHPMAGAERMGVAAARADLFVGAVCVITPTRKSSPAAVRKVEQLWKSVGSRLLRLAPEAHDESGEPVEPSAARGRGATGKPDSQPGAFERAGDALRQWVPGHDAHCVRLAGDVAGHRAREPEEPVAGAGDVHGWPAGFRRALKSGERPGRVEVL